MKRFIIILSSVFEFIFYTFFMVLIDGIEITNQVFDLLIHFIGLVVVALVFYFLIRIILSKLDMKDKKYIYYLIAWNLGLTLIAPILLIFIIPSEYLTNLAFLVLISAVYYGILINIIIALLNTFLTNRGKKLG